ncbi:MAG: hypothetical protein JWQ44_2954 [Chthoniobacter sp.]|nr:hypothetical protein [Chthoniobacter sp.]
MLTPADLRAMTPEARTRLFDEMATAYWGRGNYGVVAAEAFETTSVTVSRWKSKHNVPCTVLYTLDAWLNSEQYAAKLFADLEALPEQLSAACQQLSLAGRTLATIGQRLPRFIQTQLAAASQDTGSYSPEPQSEPEFPQSSEA